MDAPNLTTADVTAINSNFQSVGAPIKGGQKQVFPCIIDSTRYMVKFIKVGESPISQNDVLEEGDEEAAESTDEATLRARRELSIMQQINSPFLVKPGPIGLTTVNYKEQQLAYFTEEYVDGQDLFGRLSKGALDERSTITLGIQINSAIRELWKFAKIHRDIKPHNIMVASAGDYVLLDLGLAFDLTDTSLSGNFIVGTPAYFSPEQLDFALKRQMDFRSDLFALGIVMYEAITGKHPFFSDGMSQNQGLLKLINSIPDKPSSISQCSEELSEIIMRLLNKSPHMRFRSCDLFERDLKKIEEQLP